ncbi:MAG: acyloxyacyl hydrolase [Tenuifilaceae bacterium]
MNRKLLIFFLFLFSSYASFSQIRRFNDYYKISKNLGFEFSSGVLVPHHNVLDSLKQGFVSAFEISYKLRVDGNKYWHRYYNFPAFGVSLMYTDFNNKKVLGSAISANTYLKFNLIETNWQTLQLKVASGVAYIGKTYDSVRNPKNIAISSKINLALNLGISSRIILSRGNHVTIGINALHYSNGSFKKPNYGLNFILGSIGYNFSIGTYRKFSSNKTNQINREKSSMFITYSGAIKEAGDPGGQKYYAQSLSYIYLVTYEKLLHYGGAIDIMYDESSFVHIRQDSLARTSKLNALKAGITLQGEMSLDKLSFFGDFGAYLYNKDKHVGPLYQRIGVRYNINSFLKVQLALKTHFNVADHIEFGVIYKIKTTQNRYTNKWKNWYE